MVFFTTLCFYTCHATLEIFSIIEFNFSLDFLCYSRRQLCLTVLELLWDVVILKIYYGWDLGGQKGLIKIGLPTPPSLQFLFVQLGFCLLNDKHCAYEHHSVYFLPSRHAYTHEIVYDVFAAAMCLLLVFIEFNFFSKSLA